MGLLDKIKSVAPIAGAALGPVGMAAGAALGAVGSKKEKGSSSPSSPPAALPRPRPAPKPPTTNWWMIAAIAAAFAIVGVILYFRKRRPSFA